MNKQEELNNLLALLDDSITDLSKWSVYNNDLYNYEIHHLKTILALIKVKEEEREMNSVIGYAGAEEYI